MAFLEFSEHFENSLFFGLPTNHLGAQQKLFVSANVVGPFIKQWV